MCIRPAADSDIDEVRACLEAAFEPYRVAYTPDAFSDTVPARDGLVLRLRRMRVLVAEDDGGRIVGTIAHESGASGVGHLRGMAVLPEQLGSGTAARLLEAAEHAVRAAGCSRVTLDTTAPLRRATRFYERQGYRPTGRVTDFFGMLLFEYEKNL